MVSGVSRIMQQPQSWVWREQRFLATLCIQQVYIRHCLMHSGELNEHDRQNLDKK